MGGGAPRARLRGGSAAALALWLLLAPPLRGQEPRAPGAPELPGATAEPILSHAPPIAVDDVWQVLPPVADLAAVPAGLRAAARELGNWQIDVAGVAIDAGALRRAAARTHGEPVVRAVREELRRAFDPIDLLRFLDDVLAAGRAGRRLEPFFITPGRARDLGITIHPDEVFEARPRAYPAGKQELHIDRPLLPDAFPAAADGEPLGARWTSRFPNPPDEAERLARLRAARPDYAARIASLIEQLRAQGAHVELTSTLRPRERGYLMWGAFVLGQAASAADLDRAFQTIAQRNEEWGLRVPILWKHPDGWEATRSAARQMADVYDVVYATEEGAHNSNHYTGVAADLVAVDLPRSLTLVAPAGGAQKTFDLSGPDETRDLSLTPALIAWIEEQFGVRKLRADYPHWEDAR